MTLASLTSSTGTKRCARASIRSNHHALYTVSAQSPKRKTTQRRTIWQSSRQPRGKYSYYSCIRTDRGPRRRVAGPQQTHGQGPPWWNWGLGWGEVDKAGSKDFFEAERIRARQRREQIKRAIDPDPHSALFGRRIDQGPVGLWEKHENSLSNLCRSIFGIDRDAGGTKTADTTAHVKPAESKPSDGRDTQPKEASNDNVSVESSRNTINTKAKDVEFDPISGRMVPKKPEALNIGEEGGDSKPSNLPNKTSSDDRRGYLSPIERSEAEVASNSADAKEVQPSEPEQRRADGITQSGEKEIDMASEDHSSELPQTHQEPSSASTTTMDESSPAFAMPPPPNSDASLQNQSPNESNLNDAREAGSISQIVQGGLHPDTLGSDTNGDKTPAKLKIQDSTKQSEPVLVPENEDLDMLRASEIRASYNSNELSPEAENKELHKATENEIRAKGSVDDTDAQNIQIKPQDQDTLGSLMRQLELEGETSQGSSLRQAQDDTNALKQASDIHPPPSNEPSPATYRVLAYDASTTQVTRAETNSSFPSVDEVLHPTEVLSRLNNAAKFLPYFTEMRKDGYEIVSGGGDILVFQRSDEGGGTKQYSSQKDEIGEQLPLEQPGSTSLAKLKSPSRSTEPNKSRPERSGFGDTIRRMLFAGSVTAGTCYAIGVVGEYFRTGGQDGRGIDGFTEFESERRHRD